MHALVRGYDGNGGTGVQPPNGAMNSAKLPMDRLSNCAPPAPTPHLFEQNRPTVVPDVV
jgi:hypothetical protein